MVKGLERRTALETNEDRSLRAMGQIKPVQLPAGSSPAASPRLPRVQVADSVGASIASGFAEYATGVLGQAARTQQEKAMMNGQMAAQQGKTFAEVEMGGDKWALEGYRLVEAQRMSSALLTAQRAEIASGLYEADPDQYRANFVNRVDGVLASASDQRVAELARDQLLKQMPVLVDDHMTQHLAWKEQRNFDALANSVDTISMDPTSSEALIAFATGKSPVDEGNWSGPVPFDPARHKPQDIGLGGPSTEYLITVGDDEIGYTVLPSIWWAADGSPRKLSQEAAAAMAERYAEATGAQFPQFDTVGAADEFARNRSNAGGASGSRLVGGPSPTAGLSADRRREAVVAGIVQAFDNDNPQAYAVLASAGVIKQLPHAMQQKIKQARAGFESRSRNKYNAEFITSERDLMRQVETGALEPQQAMDLYGDLMAQHNMTMTMQEAGAIYDAAGQGVRGRKVNTALATHEAMVRGDRQTAVNLIRRSLSGTESGGNSAAFRTNTDGRSYGGNLQFGAARLADYAAATGTTPILPDEFKSLSAAEQAVIEDWHINNVLDHIEAKGYDKLIEQGASVNGVSLTYSGLVAVAHLGGTPGLDKFVSSGGTYNPADQLGTSLTDYLRKHGNGVDLTYEQQAAAAQRRIAVVTEASAIDAYEQMQPQFDAIDEAFRDPQSTMTEEQWRAARADVRAQFSVSKTMAEAKFERDVALEVQKAAEAQLDEENTLAASLKIEQAVNAFDEVLRSYAKGEVSSSDVLTAQQALLTQQKAIRDEYGLTLDADQDIAEYRKQSAAMRAAMEKRLQFDQEQVSIDAAEMSGTIDELPATLQKRAVEAQRATVQREVQEAISSGQIDPQGGVAAYTEKMADYYARTGMVDPVLERTMNGFLAAGLVNSKGEPTAEYIEAAEQYRTLARRSPTLADKYVRPENRPLLDAVMDLAGQGDVAGAVRTMGIRQQGAPRARTVDDLMSDQQVVRGIDTAVSQYLAREDIGVLQALTTRDADLQQTRNRSWFDQFGVQDDANREVIQGRMEQSVASAFSLAPLANPSELITGAARRVQERTPIIGGIAVPLPMQGPTAGELFFGARAADFTDQAGAINDAVMDYFRTPEFRERYSFVDDTSFAEALPTWLGGAPETQLQTLFTGVRPFQTYWDATSKAMIVQFALPGGGYSDAIALDTRTIGQRYIKQHTANAAD